MREDDIRDIFTTLMLPVAPPGISPFDAKKHLIYLEIRGKEIRFMLEGSPQQIDYFQKIKDIYEQTLKATYPEMTVLGALTTPKAEKMQDKSKPFVKKTIPGVHKMIAVASGKGGVGKSCVAANLAVSLGKAGYRVGLLDADIYGPSLPKMFGIQERPEVSEDKKLIPVERYGIKVISIGMMIPEEKAVIWRGPMVQNALQQLLTQVAWGALDFLILDMPPGTGDTQLTLSQHFELTGAIVVSTPQDIALLDARKGIQMFQQVGVTVLGIVENMSTFHCPHCHHQTDIFSHGGAADVAREIAIPLLAEIPLHVELRMSADAGVPFVFQHPDHPISHIYRNIVKKITQN